MRTKDDAGEQYSCQQLARWIDQLASEAGDFENEIDDLQWHLGNLENSYSDNLTNAAIGVARGSREIREALDQLDQLESLYDAIEGTANELESEWDQNRCEIYS